ncbi:MAG: DUF4829 domain-containing protein [Clostridiales Family XIII bacterium]|jgi:hypothetical protein|nr:DUF4829 domain-containing protein [Clostridiales Family XIII bacterium]
MKKIFVVLLLLLLVLSFSACVWNPGKTGSAKITSGGSAKFSQAELQAAADCVLKKFKDFKGCTLKKLWYDEDRSREMATAYSFEGNAIILFSDFRSDSSGPDQGFAENTDYIGWNWILIRDSKDGKWKVKDWGYG